MFLARTATRNLRVNTLPKNAMSSSSTRRMMSVDSTVGADSHDDFKPKRTVVDDGDVTALIEKQITDNQVMLYMKGTPSQPQCGFSLQTVRILNAVGVDFSSVNILDYPAIREGIKTYSDWPTIPQLYVNKEFVGGCDIVTTMFREGELETLFKDLNLIGDATEETNSDGSK